MSKKNVLILIPARFASSRFEGKPLALIDGQSMVSRVLRNCLSAKDDSLEESIKFDSYVVTDNQEIEAHIKTFSSNVIRVDDDVNSGTLRIALAYERYFQNNSYDLIINVQGDEPLLQGTELVKLAKFHLNSTFDISTLVKRQFGFDKNFMDPNKVKVAMSELDGKAFYFSRSPIPYKRDVNQDKESSQDYWFYHIGVYSYRPLSLKKFSSANITRLEDLEKLEQLRALEIGLTIGALETKSELMGVDHPDDIKKVEEVIRGRSK